MTCERGLLWSPVACKLFTIFATSSGCVPRCEQRKSTLASGILWVWVKKMATWGHWSTEFGDLWIDFTLNNLFFSLRFDPCNPHPLPKDQRKSDPASLKRSEGAFHTRTLPKANTVLQCWNKGDRDVLSPTSESSVEGVVESDRIQKCFISSTSSHILQVGILPTSQNGVSDP